MKASPAHEKTARTPKPGDLSQARDMLERLGGQCGGDHTVSRRDWTYVPVSTYTPRREQIGPPEALAATVTSVRRREGERDDGGCRQLRAAGREACLVVTVESIER